MSITDSVLITKYRKLLNLDILQSSDNLDLLYLKSNLLITDLTVLQNSIFNNLTVLSSLSPPNIVINTGTVTNNLNVLNDLISTSSLTILSDLYISTHLSTVNITNLNLICYDNITVLTNLNADILSVPELNISNIYPYNTTFNIFSPIIDIGTANSIINIIGTTNSIFVNTLNINDNLISLNINISTGGGFDIGSNSGIEIYGLNTIGYIKTTIDALRYTAKLPSYDTIYYIATQDINNNFNISGTTIINKSITTFNNIFVSNDIYMYSCSCNGNLNTGTLLTAIITAQSLTLNNKANVINLINVQNNLTSTNLLINNITTTNNMYISSTSIINSDIIINNSLTINSSMNIGNSLRTNTIFVTSDTIFNNNLTLLSDLNINNGCNINTNLTCYSNLFVSSTMNFNSNVSCYSNLTITGDTVIANTVNCTTCTFIGNVLLTLPDYADNQTAINNGLAIWQWYRTGDILKICCPP